MKKRLILMTILTFLFVSFCGFKEDEQKVYDYAELFTNDEIAELEEMCIEFAKDTKLDAIVLTTAELEGKDCFEYAADFYIENDFGYEENVSEPSGVVFMISVDPYCREIYVLTAGIAQIYIDNYDDTESILDAGYDYCTMGEYYEAEKAMLEEAKYIVDNYSLAPGTEEIIDAWYAGDYDDVEVFMEEYENNSYRGLKILGTLGIILLVSLAISGICILIMNRKYKYKMTVDGGTYFKQNSFKMMVNHDNFVRTDVSRVKIETSSGGSSGGGGGSRSYGGRSFGGGGRKF